MTGRRASCPCGAPQPGAGLEIQARSAWCAENGRKTAGATSLVCLVGRRAPDRRNSAPRVLRSARPPAPVVQRLERRSHTRPPPGSIPGSRTFVLLRGLPLPRGSNPLVCPSLTTGARSPKFGTASVAAGAAARTGGAAVRVLVSYETTPGFDFRKPDFCPDSRAPVAARGQSTGLPWPSFTLWRFCF